MTKEYSYVPSADTNATIFLCYGGKRFLIDPVLVPKGSWSATQNVSKCTHIEIFTASSCMFSWLQKIYNSLLAGSCTLHSRKFPTSHRYTPTIACLGCFVGFGISQVQACIEVSIFYIATIALINSV